MKEQTIAFIGLGLIGGSIARRLKRFSPEIKIMAYMRTRAKLEQAKADGVVDVILDGIDEKLRECDVIFLCTPVEYNAQYLALIKPFLKEEAMITDVGSTKTSIHEEVTRLGMDRFFVGGHPMAGSEKTGYEHSNDHLLENAYYIVTPSFMESDSTKEAEENRSRCDRLVGIAKAIGAIPMVLDYHEHDKVVAAVSHLPHIVASSLVNLVKDSDNAQGTMKQVAAGGFKDITRIASASPEMWEQICMTNKENLIRVLDCYLEQLTSVKKQLEEADGNGLYRFFETSRNYRNSIPDSSAGPIKKMYAFYCDMVDEAGGVAVLSTILAAGGVRLKNIGIIHNREFEEAVLKVELYDEASYEKAIALLRKYRYTIYER